MENNQNYVMTLKSQVALPK